VASSHKSICATHFYDVLRHWIELTNAWVTRWARFLLTLRILRAIRCRNMVSVCTLAPLKRLEVWSSRTFARLEKRSIHWCVPGFGLDIVSGRPSRGLRARAPKVLTVFILENLSSFVAVHPAAVWPLLEFTGVWWAWRTRLALELLIWCIKHIRTATRKLIWIWDGSYPTRQGSGLAIAACTLYFLGLVTLAFGSASALFLWRSYFVKAFTRIITVIDDKACFALKRQRCGALWFGRLSGLRWIMLALRGCCPLLSLWVKQLVILSTL